MNLVQGTKPSGQKLNRLLDAVFTVLKYNKITIDHDIYIKVLSDGTLSYPTVYNYHVINTTNNYTSFNGLTRVFEE